MLGVFSTIFLATASFLSPTRLRQTSLYCRLVGFYAGWTPYHYLMQSGIMRKWADKYGIRSRFNAFDTHLPSTLSSLKISTRAL